MTQIEAVLCDLDGTLVDTMPGLFKVYCEFLQRHQKQGSVEEFESLVGLSLYEFTAILKKHHALKEKDEEIVREYYQLIEEVCGKDVRIHEGVKKFFEYVLKKKIKIAVVTSSPRSLTEAILKAVELDSYVDVLITAETVERTKPNPDPYLKALEILKVQSVNALAIEDSYLGMESAFKAGVKTLLLWKSIPSSSNMVISIQNWQEALEYLQETYG